jgi:hypothetical protein
MARGYLPHSRSNEAWQDAVFPLVSQLESRMKSRLLQSVRWALIVLFSAILLYLAYAAIISLVPPIFRGEAAFGLLGSILVTLVFSGVLGLFPAIMLHSLLTKRLYGFASSIGAIIALAFFFGAMSLPRAADVMNFMELWSPASPSAAAMKLIVSMAVVAGMVILPFWLLFRMIRLTNEWIYPRLLKPLEEKI